MPNFNASLGFNDPIHFEGAPTSVAIRDLSSNLMDAFSGLSVTNTTTTAIRDLSGNLMDAFSGLAVTNLTSGSTVSKSLAGQWNVKARVTTTRTVFWGVRTSNSNSLLIQWNARSKASKGVSALWSQRTRAPKGLAVYWNVVSLSGFTAVTKNLSGRWNTRAIVSKALIVRYNVVAKTLVSQSLTVRWHVAEIPPPIQIFVPTFISVQDVISDSHRKTARVVVYDGLNGQQIYASDDLLVPGGLITGGVNFANASIRRRASLAFIDRTGVLTPGDINDIFSIYGHVFKVWRGVVVNGVNYDFPLGAFGITDVSVDDSGPGVQISLEGYDYGDLLGRRGLIQDYTVPKGTNFGSAIQTLLSQQMPGIHFNFETTSYTTPALFFQTNANPWDIATMMAKAIGCDLFFDQNGTCTMRTVPDYSVVPVGFTYEEGAKATALYVNKRYTNRDAYNYFIVTGEHSGNATTGGGGPIRGDAFDDNPNSKTYYKGSYGTVPAPPVSSKLITTKEQAEQAARGLLQNSIGRAERLHFNAIVNPLHEVGDVIQFTRAKSKIDNRYVIDSGYIPLGHDQPMDLTTRVRQSLA